MKNTQLIRSFLKIVSPLYITQWLILMIFPEEFIFQTAKITLNEAVKSTKEPKDTITFDILSKAEL